jgi:hypothetical protein
VCRREVDGAAGCRGWAESARAKLRLNTAETLTDVFGDVDVTALPLVPATVAPLEFAPPCRRASATRLKQALRCQLDAERERAKQVTLIKVYGLLFNFRPVSILSLICHHFFHFSQH